METTPFINEFMKISAVNSSCKKETPSRSRENYCIERYMSIQQSYAVTFLEIGVDKEHGFFTERTYIKFKSISISSFVLKKLGLTLIFFACRVTRTLSVVSFS
jgi:hypothetical protein